MITLNPINNIVLFTPQSLNQTGSVNNTNSATGIVNAISANASGVKVNDIIIYNAPDATNNVITYSYADQSGAIYQSTVNYFSIDYTKIIGTIVIQSDPPATQSSATQSQSGTQSQIN